MVSERFLRCMGQWNRDTYGPISEGVTGSDGGGGRLMSVGVVIVEGPRSDRSRAGPWICVSCVSFDRKVSPFCLVIQESVCWLWRMRHTCGSHPPERYEAVSSVKSALCSPVSALCPSLEQAVNRPSVGRLWRCSCR